jgi:hypothetical protein
LHALLQLCWSVSKSAAIFVGLMRACSQPLPVLMQLLNVLVDALKEAVGGRKLLV